MKFMRKNDELENYQINKSLKFLLGFYTLTLLIWSIYEYFKTGKMGIQFGILCLGQIIFFSCLAIQQIIIQKLDK